MKKVLVTRLEADSQRTADRLAEAGFEPVIMPLVELTATGRKPKSRTVDFTIFTSANGVKNVPEEIAAGFKAKPAYAVGPRTAEILLKKAYKDIRIGAGTASDLAELVLAEQVEEDASGVYFCGHERSFDFGKAFAGKLELELCETYKIQKRNLSKGEIDAVLSQISDGAVLVYSPAGARRFLEVLTNFNSGSVLESLTMVTISERAAEPFRNKEVWQVVIAPEPNEQSMLDEMKKLPV